jgi:hypothetical protein
LPRIFYPAGRVTPERKDRTMIEAQRKKADEAMEKKGMTRLTGYMTIAEQVKVFEEYAKVQRTCTIAEFTGKLITLGLKEYITKENNKLFLKEAKKRRREKRGI